MANFTEDQIQEMINELKDEFGPEIATRELAVLELEDMERKGCTHESANKFDQCYDCPNSEKCPMLDWQKRHPEYANDELAMKIKVLEAGGEEAYKAKMQKKIDAEREQEAQVSAVKKMRENLVQMALANTSPYTLLELEKYVQARINLALKRGITTL